MGKVIAIIALVVILAGGGFVIYNSNHKNGSTTTLSTSNTATPPPSASTPAATATPSTATGSSVAIENFMFSPAALTVKKGTTVTWTNKDSAAHTVTSTDGGKLNSSTLNKGQTYAFTFDTTGTFNYKCTFHSNMTATVTVTE